MISVTDANAAAQQLTKQAFDSMTGSMTDFLTKSKASFKDYAASFFNLATKMIVQLYNDKNVRGWAWWYNTW